MKKTRFLLGVDVGSTTVKAVLLENSPSFPVVGQFYERHRGYQNKTLYTLLKRINKKTNFFSSTTLPCITGSGGTTLAIQYGFNYLQEVNALTFYCKKIYSNIQTVVDLGGQDAKAILWKNMRNGEEKCFTFMNDKCAGGTGATIDRVLNKLGVSPTVAADMDFDAALVRPVSSKCGIFAESDINSLQKNGCSQRSCISSLFSAIVRQNIGNLTGGKGISPPVLLLGGPHSFFPPLVAAWRSELSEQWEKKKIQLSTDLNSLVFVPENAVYFAAFGTCLYWNENRIINSSNVFSEKNWNEFGRDIEEFKKTKKYIGVKKEKHAVKKHPDTVVPIDKYKQKKSVNIFIGIDAGSTSVKAVALDTDNQVVASVYQISNGTPLEEAREVLLSLELKLRNFQLPFTVRGCGVTGYAKDFLKPVLDADVSVVETSAHLLAAQMYYKDVDTIVDVGGQDIKVIIIKNGCVSDFRLNTQCSAGNGFYLQNAATRFNIDIENYAARAFAAKKIPDFNIGCAVFLEAEIVTLQQNGWEPDEILAGLARVLPKNVWEFVVQETNIKKLGPHFLLQGGAHRNNAVVKEQEEYILARVPEATITVHKHCELTGAIGAAYEAYNINRKSTVPFQSKFIGFEQLRHLHFSVSSNESTRCSYCKNHCIRTDILVKRKDGTNRHFIVAPCERGEFSNKRDFTDDIKNYIRLEKNTVNFSDIMSKSVFEKTKAVAQKHTLKHRGIYAWKKKKEDYPVIGIPRILNIWRYAPLFIGYLQSIGIPFQNIVWSDITSQNLWKKGREYNSVDLCYPGKYGVAHIFNLLQKNIDIIINPAIVTLDSELKNSSASAACPVATSNPDVIKASFTLDIDIFKEKNIKYHTPILHFMPRERFSRDLLKSMRSIFEIRKSVHEKAFAAGLQQLDLFYSKLRKESEKKLKQLKDSGRIGILFLCQPYHYDQGLNHGIPQWLQRHGYPIFTIESLPRDQAFLQKLFQNDMNSGLIEDVMDINDVWSHSISENANRKIWGAKFAARHPNLAIVDFLSFRCGPDAATLHVIENIAQYSETPYFAFHDMDQNKPEGSIRIRLETIDYFLKEYVKKKDLQSA